MLWVIFVILVILWVLGLVSGYTMGGVVHVLLLIAIALLIVRLNQRRIRLNQRTKNAVAIWILPRVSGGI